MFLLNKGGTKMEKGERDAHCHLIDNTHCSSILYIEFKTEGK